MENNYMLISERARNTKLEYVYAPYITVTRSEEESKRYKHMRRTVGCTNGCFFSKSIPHIEQCNKCYEAALNKEKI